MPFFDLSSSQSRSVLQTGNRGWFQRVNQLCAGVPPPGLPVLDLGRHIPFDSWYVNLVVFDLSTPTNRY